MPEFEAMSAVQATPFACLKETSQRGSVRFIGAQSNGIDAGAAQHSPQLRLLLLLLRGKGTARRSIRVYFHDVTGFGVLQNEPSQGRKFQFMRVDDLDCDHVVTTIRLAEGRGQWRHRLGVLRAGELAAERAFQTLISD